MSTVKQTARFAVESPRSNRSVDCSEPHRTDNFGYGLHVQHKVATWIWNAGFREVEQTADVLLLDAKRETQYLNHDLPFPELEVETKGDLEKFWKFILSLVHPSVQSVGVSQAIVPCIFSEMTSIAYNPVQRAKRQNIKSLHHEGPAG
jgi:hypothetical protein